MDDIASIKKKIGAILAMAHSTNNEHEAAAFMAKAEVMMEKYQLEIWQLGDVGDPMGKEEGLRWQDATPGLNDHKLLHAVCRYYGCQMVHRTSTIVNSRGRTVPLHMLDIIGRESARVTVMLMMPFIMEQCKAAGAKLTEEGHGAKAKTTLRVINALCSRIWHMVEDAKRKARVDAVGKAMESRALVVVKELDAFMAAEYGKLKTGKARSTSTTDAARHAAAGVSLHRQTSGASQLKIGSR